VHDAGDRALLVVTGHQDGYFACWAAHLVETVPADPAHRVLSDIVTGFQQCAS
jgi:hypothetical protein